MTAGISGSIHSAKSGFALSEAPHVILCAPQSQCKCRDSMRLRSGAVELIRRVLFFVSCCSSFLGSGLRTYPKRTTSRALDASKRRTTPSACPSASVWFWNGVRKRGVE